MFHDPQVSSQSRAAMRLLYPCCLRSRLRSRRSRPSHGGFSAPRNSSHLTLGHSTRATVSFEVHARSIGRTLPERRSGRCGIWLWRTRPWDAWP